MRCGAGAEPAARASRPPWCRRQPPLWYLEAVLLFAGQAHTSLQVPWTSATLFDEDATAFDLVLGETIAVVVCSSRGAGLFGSLFSKEAREERVVARQRG